MAELCCLTAGYPGLLPPHMMHGVPPELMAAGVLGPGLLPYARPQLVSVLTIMMNVLNILFLCCLLANFRLIRSEIDNEKFSEMTAGI